MDKHNLIVSVLDSLPPNNTFVLVHYRGGNWRDSDDQYGREWRVAKFQRGLSSKERDLLPDDDERKKTWKPSDEGFNNERPYRWSNLFGQDVDYWYHLPRQSTKAIAYIKKVSTGIVRKYTIEFYDNNFIWEEGNYACDCNRELFFERAIGNEPDNVNCGSERFLVNIEVNGKIVYEEYHG